MTRRSFLKVLVGTVALLSFGKLAASERGSSLVLNETGMRIYKGYVSGRNVEQIASDLVAEYEVDYETALRDTKEFISTLRAMGI
ncbi:MAG: PqqD family protein [Thermotogae bacterium]|nr:PqqD family protein [Thermotogota bacterium]